MAQASLVNVALLTDFPWLHLGRLVRETWLDSNSVQASFHWQPLGKRLFKKSIRIHFLIHFKIAQSHDLWVHWRGE